MSYVSNYERNGGIIGDKCDPIFVKDKKPCMCIYMHRYVLIYAKERVRMDIRSAVHNGNPQGRGLYGCVHTGRGIMLLFLYRLIFFTGMYYFCNKNIYKDSRSSVENGLERSKSSSSKAWQGPS